MVLTGQYGKPMGQNRQIPGGPNPTKDKPTFPRRVSFGNPCSSGAFGLWCLRWLPIPIGNSDPSLAHSFAVAARVSFRVPGGFSFWFPFKPTPKRVQCHQKDTLTLNPVHRFLTRNEMAPLFLHGSVGPWFENGCRD